MMSTTVQADERITAGQRRALFAWAGRRGLDIDDLRAATPRGSISELTRSQAARMIELLNGRTGRAEPIKPRETVTPRQWGLLTHLADLTRYSPAGLETWLRKHFGIGSIDEITDKSEASRVIGGLLRMHQTYESKLQGAARS